MSIEQDREAQRRQDEEWLDENARARDLEHPLVPEPKPEQPLRLRWR